MRSNREWQAWGRMDPLWSVASWDGKQRNGPSPWTPGELLALGAADFRDVLRHWRHFGMTPGTCVEIGCGAGRMTTQLVTVFKAVAALDVSADQIDLARQLLGPKASAVQFYQVNEPAISLSDHSCTGMFRGGFAQRRGRAGTRSRCTYIRASAARAPRCPPPAAARASTNALRTSPWTRGPLRGTWPR